MSVSDSLFWLAVGMLSGCVLIGVSIGIEWAWTGIVAALEAWIDG